MGIIAHSLPWGKKHDLVSSTVTSETLTLQSSNDPVRFKVSGYSCFFFCVCVCVSVGGV